MGKTSIEWCDHTINPIRARLNGRTGHHCVKVSPGCKNCYASRMQSRFGMPPFEVGKREGVEVFLDAGTLVEVLKRRKPTRYFWCDMSDLFGEWVPDETIAACFGVMAATPQHTHLVLTKRPERMVEWFKWVEQHRASTQYIPHETSVCVAAAEPIVGPLGAKCAWPLPNVWLGVSCEDQQRADERIPLLLQVPAAVRFVSAEPLLGPIDFRNGTSNRWSVPTRDVDGVGVEWTDPGPNYIPVDWVIVGGESGPGARPCNVEWIRSIVKQCAEAGTACFVKQLGAVPLVGSINGFTINQLDASQPQYGDDVVVARFKSRKGGDMDEWPEDLRVREMPGVANG
jgi:protein gp37